MPAALNLKLDGLERSLSFGPPPLPARDGSTAHDERLKFHAMKHVDLTPAFMQKTLRLGPDALQHGKFENGLTYFVLPNVKPKDRASLALVVRVGSLVEAENERGVAHIVEHLAFNATERFDAHEIIKFLEKIGAEFGACSNAYTSSDETCFELTVPTDKDGLLEDSLDVLKEFAAHVRASPADLDNERGAVLEEWRSGRGAEGRASEAHFKLIFGTGLYAERFPIGLESVIRKVSASTVKTFYDRYYRPELMAVIAVGDFGRSAPAIVELIRDRFEGLAPRAPGPPRPLPAIDAPETLLVANPTPRFGVRRDAETTSTSVVVSYISPRGPPLNTPAAYRVFLAQWLFESILGQRLYKISRQLAPPFFTASVDSSSPVRAAQRRALSASVGEHPLAAATALECLLSEVARVRRHGFTARELAAAKARALSNFEALFLERDQVYSDDRRDEYVATFLSGDYVLDGASEALMATSILPSINADETAAQAEYYGGLKSTDGIIVEVTAGARGARGITSTILGAVVARVAAREASGALRPWDDGGVPEHLIERPLAIAGGPVSRKEYPKVGATEVSLANGLRLCLCPKAFLRDQCLIYGYAPGGLSERSKHCATPSRAYRAASASNTIAEELGVFGFKPPVLEELLAGKRVGMSSSIGTYFRSFGGDVSPVDLETGAQLVHLLFTAMVKGSPEDLAVLRQLQRERLLAKLNDPDVVYSQRVKRVNSCGHPYYLPMTVKEFDAIDCDAALEYFSSAYSDPSAFTVVVVGGFAVEQALPVLTKWFGGIPLPKSGPHSGPKGPLPVASIELLEAPFPLRPVHECIRVPMVHAYTASQITFPVVMRGLMGVRWLRLVVRVIEARLMRLLRFKYGDIYSVSCSSSATGPAIKDGDQDTNDGYITVSFSSDPARAEALVTLCLTDIDDLQKLGPEEDDVATAVELERRLVETAQAENTFWRDRVVLAYQSPSYAESGDLDAVVMQREACREAVFEAATSATARAFLRAALPLPASSRYTAITLLPATRLWRARYALAAGLIAIGGVAIAVGAAGRGMRIAGGAGR